MNLIKNNSKFPYTLKLFDQLKIVDSGLASSAQLSFSMHAYDKLPTLENLARKIVLIMGSEAGLYFDGYKWMCEKFHEEQVYFVRNKRYRHSNFETVLKEVYSNAEFMKKYMDGLLLSQLFWFNHAKSYLRFLEFLDSYENKFCDYLEIGPGHGLFLSEIANNNKISSIAACDISSESLVTTNLTLDRLGIKAKIEFIQKDIQLFDIEERDRRYDLINISEVLEHLENPNAALLNLSSNFCKPNGKFFISIPINSPAPDHIYQFSSKNDVMDLVKNAKLEIEDVQLFPISGYDLAYAEKICAPISCIVIAKKKG
jgi:2-polyprenyl-3-methyl-5-hydroxy-6-metoxy-1,4-benzoquinol methylase